LNAAVTHDTPGTPGPEGPTPRSLPPHGLPRSRANT